jgi:XTP/dITP diphosphohydrolase
VTPARRIVVATGNAGKLREFREALPDVETVGAVDVGLTGLPEETGVTYEENALVKAGFGAIRSRLPCLADDSGLEVDALGGMPGVMSARYGGPMSDGERIAYLLANLRGVPEERRGAEFVCVLAFATPGGFVRTFRGTCRGVLLEGPRGDGGFGYDPVFFSPELGMTFSEASAADKRQVSHRGHALRAFKAWLESDEGREETNRSRS